MRAMYVRISLILLKLRRQMRVGGQGHVSAILPAGKRPDTHCAVGCMGPRAGLDG